MSLTGYLQLDDCIYKTKSLENQLEQQMKEAKAGLDGELLTAYQQILREELALTQKIRKKIQSLQNAGVF